MMVAVLNYLYHPVLSRMMSLEDFGDVQVLFSIFTQASVVLMVFDLIALNVLTNQEDPNESGFGELYTLTFYVTGSIALLLLVGASFIKNSFQLGSTSGIVLVALSLVVLTFFTIGKSYLQAQHEFATVSIGSAVSAGGKLLFAVVLVAFGFSVFGALMGLWLAGILSALYVHQKTKHVVGFPKIRRLNWISLQHHAWYGVLVFSAVALTTLFYTLDIVIAKYRFTPETAGVYSGIATVARIVFFVTASTGGVLLAHIKLSNTIHENRLFLMKALAIVGGLGGGTLLAMALFPEFVVGLLVGEKFLSVASLLPVFALHMFLVALTNVFISYWLALRQRVVIIAAIVGVAAVLTLSAFFHDSPRQLVYAFLGSSAVTLLFLVGSFVFLQPGDRRRTRRRLPASSS
jgi:O-antigen/teichoic acid export membrane protein